MAAVERFEENPKLEQIRRVIEADPQVFLGLANRTSSGGWFTGDGMPFGFPSSSERFKYLLGLTPATLTTNPDKINLFIEYLLPYFKDLNQPRKLKFVTSSDLKRESLYVTSFNFRDHLADVVIKPQVLYYNEAALAKSDYGVKMVPDHTYPVFDVLEVNISSDPQRLIKAFP